MFCLFLKESFRCFLAPLVSKNESLEVSALASFRALARQVANGQTITQIVQYLFNIFNGLIKNKISNQLF